MPTHNFLLLSANANFNNIIISQHNTFFNTQTQTKKDNALCLAFNLTNPFLSTNLVFQNKKTKQFCLVFDLVVMTGIEPVTLWV
jgi:hypothetical protein